MASVDGRAGRERAGPAAASVGVVVVTHRAREHLGRCLPPLLASSLRPRVLVVNSSSGDGTVEEARRLGAEVLVVPRQEFNHGSTRELARREIGTDVVAMLSPDAYPTDAGFLERLTAPVRDGLAQVAYGRQLARDGADLVERLGREFNYPAGRSHVRSLADWPRLGSYTHFCSNACAAWSNAALDAVGGFPPTLVSEETAAAALILRRGGRIAYVAEAAVVHSHPQGLADEFARHFDIGYARSRFRSLLRAGESDEARGLAFAALVLTRAWREDPRGVPHAAARLAAKWLGFRAGLLGPSLGVAVARRLSGQDYFWDTPAAADGTGLVAPTLAALEAAAAAAAGTTPRRRATDAAEGAGGAARPLPAEGWAV